MNLIKLIPRPASQIRTLALVPLLFQLGNLGSSVALHCSFHWEAAEGKVKYMMEAPQYGLWMLAPLAVDFPCFLYLLLKCEHAQIPKQILF